MLKSSLDALKRRTGRVTARLRGLPHPSRFSKGGDHAPPRFIRHIAARIALVASSHAEAPSSLLRIRILALHHFQLLSTAALAKYTAPAHLVSGNSGAGAATVHLRGGRLRGHAGAFPSADQRAGAGKSFYRDAGSKTALRAEGSARLAQAQ